MYKFDETGKVWEVGLEEGLRKTPDGKKDIGFSYKYYKGSKEDDEEDLKSSVKAYLEENAPDDCDFDIDFDYSKTITKESFIKQ